MVRLALISILILLAYELDGQVDAFARASVDKNKVLLEQPVKIKVSAHSATWFASPLNIANLQVEGAFVQSFKRTQSSIQYINNKKYASLEFHYILFPYREGELIFPALNIQTNIPPEGDYKGQPVTLTTEAITITVEPIPEKADADHWLVATNASIKNEWSAPINNLKVGDVLGRTITIRAEGTLPSFIDEPDVGLVDFASLYPSEPSFYDERDAQTAKGRRVDFYSYLLEKAGEFTLPEVEVIWWNPYLGRYYSRKLPEYKLQISENEDLLALTQLKDSLDALNMTALMESEEEEEFNWLDFLKRGALLILIAAALWLLYGGVRIVMQKTKARKHKKLNSEAYLFRIMLKQENKEDLINHMYHWIKRTEAGSENPTLNPLNDLDQELGKEISELKKAVYSDKQSSSFNLSNLKKSLRASRSHWLASRKKSSRQGAQLKGLNPS